MQKLPNHYYPTTTSWQLYMYTCSCFILWLHTSWICQFQIHTNTSLVMRIYKSQRLIRDQSLMNIYDEFLQMIFHTLCDCWMKGWLTSAACLRLRMMTSVCHKFWCDICICIRNIVHYFLSGSVIKLIYLFCSPKSLNMLALHTEWNISCFSCT